MATEPDSFSSSTFTWYPYIDASTSFLTKEAIGERWGWIGYRVDDGWLVAYSFARTSAGVLDLVGFLIEWVATTEAGRLRVVGIALRPTPSPAPRGATSRQIRQAANYSGHLARARDELHALISKPETIRGLGEQVVRRPGRIDGPEHQDLVELVMQYQALLSAGVPAARKALADQRSQSEGAIKEWLRRARDAGLWATSGPGKPGNPTPLAYELAREMGD